MKLLREEAETLMQKAEGGMPKAEEKKADGGRGTGEGNGKKPETPK